MSCILIQQIQDYPHHLEWAITFLEAQTDDTSFKEKSSYHNLSMKFIKRVFFHRLCLHWWKTEQEIKKTPTQDWSPCTLVLFSSWLSSLSSFRILNSLKLYHTKQSYLIISDWAITLFAFYILEPKSASLYELLTSGLTKWFH